MKHDSFDTAQNLHRRIHAVRQKQMAVTICSRALIAVSLLLAAGLFLSGMEAVAGFSKFVRTILFFAVAVAAAGGVGWWFVRLLLQYGHLLPSETDEELAGIIGNAFPAIRDRFVNILQLAQEPDHLYSTDLVKAALHSFEEETAAVDFTQSVSTMPVRRARTIFFVAAGIVCLSLVVAPAPLGHAAYRLIHFRQDFLPPAKYRFVLLPGSKDVVKGETVAIRIQVFPESSAWVPSMPLILAHRIMGEDRTEELSLLPDSGGAYHTTFSSLRQTTEYFARFDHEESPRHLLTVLDRPILRSFHLQLKYPSYTHLPPKQQDEFVGDVTAPVGTQVTISGRSEKELQQAALVFGDSVRVVCSVSGKQLSGSFTVRGENRYTLRITDESGLQNSDPVQYDIHAIPDEYPVVNITEPGRSVDIAGSQSLPLRLQLQDDYGFTALRIGYRLTKSKYAPPQKEFAFFSIPLPTGSGTTSDIPYTWDLSALNLVPEDEVEYAAEVFDNDGVHGPKSARSQLFVLRLPSLQEVFAEAKKDQTQTVDDVKESVEQANRLKENIEALQRDVKKNKEPDWTTKKKIDDMAKRVDAVQKKMDEAAKRVEQLTMKLQQQNSLSRETLDKYLELQSLMKQLDGSELQKMLQQLQHTPSLNKEQLQRAAEQMKFSEEEFQRSLDRALELLKRLRVEQSMDEVKKRAEALAQEQQKIQKEMNQASEEQRKNLAGRQEELQKQEQAMEQAAEELQKQMDEFFADMPAEQMRQAMQQYRQEHVQQDMQQAATQMRSGSPQQARMAQQRAQKSVEQFSKAMSEMQRQMLQKQAQYVMTELRKAEQNLLDVSKDQEAVKMRTEQGGDTRQTAEEQQRAAQNLQHIIQALMHLSDMSFAVTPQMGKALNSAASSMNGAMQQLSMHNSPQAAERQEAAMASINRSAQEVQSAIQSMMQGQQGGGQGAGSLMQQLQRLAGEQMSLNMQTQQMQSGGMSPQHASGAARLAQQQAALEKSLEQLNKESQQSSERQRLLGDLRAITDEMKEVVKNLEQNSTDPGIAQKQERILSRLLDASRSMNERDYEKKRKSESGKTVARQSPGALDSSVLEGKNRLQEYLLKALEQGYSKDEQELIKRYFQKLEQSEKP